MSKSHTPGPWMPSANFHQTGLIVREGDGDTIAYIPNFRVYKDAEPNARLIAAAPDMLEALIKLRAVASLVPDDIWEKASDAFNHKTCNINTINDYQFTMDISAAAIDKALGK